MNALLRMTTTPSRAHHLRHYSSQTAKPSGTRGGIIGFMVGVITAGAAGYYYLMDEYNSASTSLLLSLQELQASTDKVKDYARRIEKLDREVAKLKETTATKQQLADTKVDFRKLYDTLNIEHLELKTHIWGLEKDLQNNNASDPKDA
ncbi:hypothetical protein BDF20DRAFT_884409 [Mycotypha africana]|uniref:uncharacterized protein n=1 Tax=Mycotypha africana TaxID=64632 RepID=UPI002300481E|nr:uncharacterized protein BDF20DRAFT_884409 [Mycotypha africana]KAI8971417.1 hypothetical protein BDF20DRAFT_884409 [Mycotypha africana]